MPNLKRNTFFILLILLLISGISLFIIDILIGSVNIPFEEIMNILASQESSKESWQIIVLESRLPRALAAVLCGSALSVSGLKMQTLFRNPLAGPYILGISSGAGLGVAILIMGLGFIGIPSSNNFGLIAAAIIGSSVVLLILLSVIIKLKDIMTVLILGVMIGSVITALIGIIQYFSNDAQLKSFITWTMGDLNSITNSQLTVLGPVIIIGLILSFLISKKLNTYLMGESYAISIGTNIKQTRIFIVIITAILTGSITAYCGPIGFIGIVIPHLARLITKTYNHAVLIPATALLGINVLLLADIISHLPGNEQTLPINSITSLIGIPFIIWIIFKNKKISDTN
jgi:iron complex transport system permease protein